MSASLPPETDQAIEKMALELNDQLRSTSTSRAEQTFGLSCSVLVVPLGLVLLVIYILGVRSAIGIGLAALFCLLLGVTFSVFAAQRARQSSMAAIFLEQIEPQIDLFLEEHAITRLQFVQSVRQFLPPEAYLITFITRAERINRDPLKD